MLRSGSFLERYIFIVAKFENSSLFADASIEESTAESLFIAVKNNSHHNKNFFG